MMINVGAELHAAALHQFHLETLRQCTHKETIVYITHKEGDYVEKLFCLYLGHDDKLLSVSTEGAERTIFLRCLMQVEKVALGRLLDKINQLANPLAWKV